MVGLESQDLNPIVQLNLGPILYSQISGEADGTFHLAFCLALSIIGPVKDTHLIIELISGLFPWLYRCILRTCLLLAATTEGRIACRIDQLHNHYSFGRQGARCALDSFWRYL